MKPRIRIRVTSSLLGIQVPGVKSGDEPHYAWLLNSKVRKGWAVALEDHQQYATLSIAALGDTDGYAENMKKGRDYVESLRRLG